MGSITKTRPVAFNFYPAKGKQARAGRKALGQIRSQGRKDKKSKSRTLQLPSVEYPRGGKKAPATFRGVTDLRKKGLATTAHAAATAYPFVAGPSLGHEGAMIGHDRHGGGAFCFDPWECYRKGIISGMSMLVFGQVGTGKSSLVKSLAMRLVLMGKRLSVASDKKGEWTRVVRQLGGSVIQIGPGLDTRLNPLDEGIRPSLTTQGKPMTDEAWAMMVQTRRMNLLTTVVKILNDVAPIAAERRMLSEALEMAVEEAGGQGRSPVISDMIDALESLRVTYQDDRLRADAANIMSMTLHRMTTGDLAGMFDGVSTVQFDINAPATSIDTSSAEGAPPETTRVITACAGSWMESMVTNSDSGQRLVIYEEGWDNVSSEADLDRMVKQWKLARHYGIFNILIMHKVSDLDMAGDEGSKMVSMARSLLSDADVKVIYRQDPTALKMTKEQMDLSERERRLLEHLDKGTGLWRVGHATFEVANVRTKFEIPLFDTDARMDTPVVEAASKPLRDLGERNGHTAEFEQLVNAESWEDMEQIGRAGDTDDY